MEEHLTLENFPLGATPYVLITVVILTSVQNLTRKACSLLADSEAFADAECVRVCNGFC